MAKARALDRRRKSVKNIRKITRTMELIATARFKKAMDRSVASRDYTKHGWRRSSRTSPPRGGRRGPSAARGPSDEAKTAVLVLTGNRGLCGGYNSNIVRQSVALLGQWKSEQVGPRAVSGSGGSRRSSSAASTSTSGISQFEDKPEFAAVAPIGRAYLEAYSAGEIDRLDVVYTKFDSIARQEAVTEMLLPLAPEGHRAAATAREARLPVTTTTSIPRPEHPRGDSPGELPVAALQVLPRRGRQRAGGPDGGDEGRHRERRRPDQESVAAYNRARQSQITGEIMEILGGVEALKK
jgi:F-type H+-transporting ATPase subunit gamma